MEQSDNPTLSCLLHDVIDQAIIDRGGLGHAEMFPPAVLLRGQGLVEFSVGHHSFPQELVIHVMIGLNQYDSLHSFDVKIGVSFL